MSSPLHRALLRPRRYCSCRGLVDHPISDPTGNNQRPFTSPHLRRCPRAKGKSSPNIAAIEGDTDGFFVFLGGIVSQDKIQPHVRKRSMIISWRVGYILQSVSGCAAVRSCERRSDRRSQSRRSRHTHRIPEKLVERSDQESPIFIPCEFDACAMASSPPFRPATVSACKRSLRPPWKPAEACLAGTYCPSERRRSGHLDNHGRDRQVQDLCLAHAI